jgi:hypothetical protein
MAAALIDRVLHHCHLVNIRGNSYRMRQHTDLYCDSERGVRRLMYPVHCKRRAASMAAASRHMPARIAAGRHAPNPSSNAFDLSPPP